MRLLLINLAIGLTACSYAPVESLPEGAQHSAVHVEGPVPSISAFLAPLGEPGYEAAVIVVTNPAPVPVRVLYGACSFGLRLYSNASLRGTPAWELRPDGCEAALYFLEVPSRETRTRQAGMYLSRSDIRAVLDPGEYHAAVVWHGRDTGRTHLIPVGLVRVQR